MRSRAIRLTLVVCCLVLVALLLAATFDGAADAAPSGATQTGADKADLGEILRRLTAPPFAYVGETDYDTAKLQAGEFGYSGAAAFINSITDTLAARPAVGSALQDVAVAPDGRRVYMTDAYEPVLHVFDADTGEELAAITLPGVEFHDPTVWSQNAFDEDGFPYSDMRSCSGGVACTPDGKLVLVTSSAGLQVVDAQTNRVERTIADLIGGAIAVSFDGERAYIACDDFDELAPRDFFGWFEVFMETEDCRLVCLDLATWEVIKEVPTALVAGIAVKPDDSVVFFSETYKKRVQVVDSLTLEDKWDVSTDPSFSIGIGFVPNGKKAYVVCSADSGYLDMASGSQTVPSMPSAEEFFCAVIDTAGEEIIKRIPLEAY